MACNNNSCSTHSHHHGSHDHGSHGSSCCSGSKKCGCGCGCGCGCCGSSGCGCSSCECGKKGCDFSHELLQMADDAWMELLYEKIKTKIEESCGKDLTDLASIVAHSNKARWASKMQSKDACKNYEEEIAQFFSKKKC